MLVMLLISSVASAQTTEQDEIHRRVKQGQKMSITDERGREFNGRLEIVTAQGLTIRTGDGRVDVPFGEIVRIDRPKDTNWNGARYGFIGGAGLGLSLLAWQDNRQCDPRSVVPCHRATGTAPSGMYASAAITSGMLGACVGAVVDALIRRDRNIYLRGGPRISISPVFGATSGGAVMRLSW